MDVSNLDQYVWNRQEVQYQNMGDDVSVYTCVGGNYRAYKINRDIIGQQGLDYKDEYKYLKNGYGIYFLYNIERTKYDLKYGIYIGKTEGGDDPRGMTRLVSHVENDKKLNLKYWDKWSKAIYVTIKEDKEKPEFTQGVISAIEAFFIRLFKSMAGDIDVAGQVVGSLECYNTRTEKLGNEPVDNYMQHIKAIIQLLCSGKVQAVPVECFSKMYSSQKAEETYIKKQELDNLKAECSRLKNKTAELESEIKQQESGAVNEEFEILKIEKHIRDRFRSIYKLCGKADNLLIGNRVYQSNELINFQKSNKVVTKPDIADKMVQMIDWDKLSCDSTFLALYSKNGQFAISLMNSLVSKYSSDAEDRLRNFVKNQLYIVVSSAECYNLTMKNVVHHYIKLISQLDDLWSFDVDNCILPHILLINSLDNSIKTDRERILNSFKQEFKRVNFDVVVGNPPYNRGMDLDFVNFGFDVSTKCTVMITPAKWQTAEGDQSIASTISYKEFRDKLVPHMKTVCYYPNSLDVFDKVYQIDGISYFLLDKDIHDKCNVINVQDTICSKVNASLKKSEGSDFREREIVYRNIKDGSKSLLNIGQEVIDLMDIQEQFNPDIYKNNETGKYKVWINNLVPGNQQVSAGGFLGIGKYYIQEDRPNKNQVSSYFSSDSLLECQSYASYLSSKLVRFLVSCYYSKLTGVICKQCFKFVPLPPDNKFDHIFTDDELYKYFNIPQKYIDVIDAVVKVRD